MERPTQVTVFETDRHEEAEFLKNKLKEFGIFSVDEVDNKDALGIPLDGNIIKLKVDLKDEFKAFEIIDQFWKDPEE